MFFYDPINQPNEPVYYFTYDLHMDPEVLAHLGVAFDEMCPAVLTGYRLVFNVLEDEHFRFERRGLANILPQAGAAVEGVIFRVRTESLPVLDRHAGVENLKYYRKQVHVKKPVEQSVAALTYAGWPDVTAEGLLPSRMYLQRLLTAAGRNEVSERFRQWLQGHPTAL